MLKRELKSNGSSEGDWELGQHINELVHKGGCHGHCNCTTADNVSDIDMLCQLGNEPGA